MIILRSRLVLVSIVLSMSAAGPAAAIVKPDNQGRWVKPTQIGPDQDVPGFLVNLGPTGARAIIKENSFVVKHVFAESPADKKLILDDEIIGIDGKKFNQHTFGRFYGMKYDVGYEGPIMDFGRAIEESEGSDGNLRLDVIRGGKPVSVTVKLKAIGKFSDTFPRNCAKSKQLADAAIDYVHEHRDDHTSAVHEKGTVGLALLARGKSSEAEKLAMSWNQMPDAKSWTWYPSYQCIFLCEYYLQSGDKRVLDTIKKLTERLYLSQVIDPTRYKDHMHGGRPQAKNFLKGGNGHGARVAGYGTMTITTLLAMLAWELAEDCGVGINDTHLDLAYNCIHTHTHASGYMGYRFATGAYTPVGRQGLSILVHQLAGDRDAVPYVNRVTRHLAKSKTRLNDGHGDNAQAVFWALLGIQQSGDKGAIREVFDYNKAYINMARTHDGAFVIQPGRNAAEKAYYMSPRIHLTAGMALVLGMDQPALRVQGGTE
ncbi:MAG: hypothetical protein KJO21_02405 [Verrucomicrobiae bacterium]|nr:hypothetical protein [Verrucomicrobiae bacterium]NNJ44152.1 hypothetical protein [Akkermansiaceae bacterium]